MLASPVVFGAMLMFGVAVLAGEKPIITEVTQLLVAEDLSEEKKTFSATPLNQSTQIQIANNTRIVADRLSNAEVNPGTLL